MIKNERQEKLLRILSKENTMKISDLSEKLHSSMMTIRRDLDLLEEMGIVKRYHGGVTLNRTDTNQPSFYERIEEFSNEKYAIGMEAAKFVTNGSIIFFDAGTTPLAIIEHISDDVEFTAITTGLLTAVALCNKPKTNVISIGGNIHHSSFSSVSYMSVEEIRKFHADIAFISTKSIILPVGTYEAQLQLIDIKEAIIEVCDKVVLLVDNSKFENKSMCKAIPIEKIDLIVTDDKINRKYLSILHDLGKEVIVASV